MARVTSLAALLLLMVVVVNGLRKVAPGPGSSICRRCCRGSPSPLVCPSFCRCVQPVPIRFGQCPVNDLLPRILCPVNSPDKCKNDLECGRNRRCCKYGCAKQCMPTCTPPCRLGQQCQASPGVVCLAHECRGNDPSYRDASCKPIRPSNPCNGVVCRGGSRCRVINGRGVCVPRPRPIGRGTCPKVDIVTTCDIKPDHCSSDAQCSGTQRCCSYGCGPKCLPTCRRRCPPGQTCRLERFASCLGLNCPPAPPPRAVCKPNDSPAPIRIGTCPRNNLITTCVVRRDQCLSDSECPSNQKCCNAGCGRTCQPFCRNCNRSTQYCALEKVQCVRAPCPPVPVCRSKLCLNPKKC